MGDVGFTPAEAELLTAKSEKRQLPATVDRGESDKSEQVA